MPVTTRIMRRSTEKKGVSCKHGVPAGMVDYTIAVAADAIGGACPVPRSSMSV
jgi:hypothetical protein